MPIVIGVVCQFLVMPALGLGLALLLRLSPEAAAGVVLVGACPGGTASNVMVYLSRGNTALSIAMTTISTLLAPVLTPYLTLLTPRDGCPSIPGQFWPAIGAGNPGNLCSAFLFSVRHSDRTISGNGLALIVSLAALTIAEIRCFTGRCCPIDQFSC